MHQATVEIEANKPDNRFFGDAILRLGDVLRSADLSRRFCPALSVAALPLLLSLPAVGDAAEGLSLFFSAVGGFCCLSGLASSCRSGTSLLLFRSSLTAAKQTDFKDQVMNLVEHLLHVAVDKHFTKLRNVTAPTEQLLRTQRLLECSLGGQ